MTNKKVSPSVISETTEQDHVDVETSESVEISNTVKSMAAFPNNYSNNTSSSLDTGNFTVHVKFDDCTEEQRNWLIRDSVNRLFAAKLRKSKKREKGGDPVWYNRIREEKAFVFQVSDHVQARNTEISTKQATSKVVDAIKSGDISLEDVIAQLKNQIA